jgi:hypothetical protein
MRHVSVEYFCLKPDCKWYNILFIRDGGNVIKVSITAIINQSITTGVVPQSMKYVRVKPLFKKNSPLEVGKGTTI